LWESMEPVPKPGEERWEEADTNPRYKRCIDTWQILTVILKYWSAMHEMEPDHVHEEVELQCIDFSSYMMEWQARVPRWQQYYFDHDQTPHYQYAKKVIQAMTWFKGPNRWVMKSPPMMECLPSVFAAYPDATVVMTHRDPVAVIQSAVTMMAYWDRIRRSEHDMGALADQWIYRIEQLLLRCVRDRDQVANEKVIDVMFHEYMADQMGTVRRALKQADLAMTPEAEKAFLAYLDEKPRNKLGKVIYDLKGHYGVDVKALRKRFQFYYERFPVAIEPTLGE
jgi:Sulfotransferase family